MQTWELPHFVPNVGIRLSAGGGVLAYTGDTGPSPDIVRLAEGADVFLAEASYPERVPTDSERYQSTAAQAGLDAARAGVGRLVLTHLLPGTDPVRAEGVARTAYDGEVEIARSDLRVTVGESPPR